MDDIFVTLLALLKLTIFCGNEMRYEPKHSLNSHYCRNWLLSSSHQLQNKHSFNAGILIFISVWEVTPYDLVNTKCLFWRNTPVVGQGLLIHEVSISDTLHSVGLLWTSDQIVAETST